MDPTIFYEELSKAYQAAKSQVRQLKTLGFDPDYILYRSGFFATIKKRERWTDRELAEACYSAYFRAWHRAPCSMLKKVWTQTRVFLFPRGGDFYKLPESIDLNRQLAVSRGSVGEVELSPRIQSLYHSFVQSLEKAQGKTLASPGSRFLARLADCLKRIILPLQVTFFATMIAVFLSMRGGTLRLGGLVAAAVVAATYGIVLAIAIGHSLEVNRFRVSYAPGFLLGVAMITNYLLVFGFGTRIPGKQAIRNRANPSV